MKLKSNGFTLTEIIVVIAVIVVLTAIIVPIYQGSKGQLALQRATNKLAQDIRWTEEMAMAARTLEGTSTVPTRYGIEFDTANSTSYIIFADMNGNGTRQPPPSQDIDVETIYFEKGITISQLLVDDPPVSKSKFWVTFMPPDPTVLIRDPAPTVEIGRIQLTNGNQTRVVIINKAGLIYVE